MLKLKLFKIFFLLLFLFLPFFGSAHPAPSSFVVSSNGEVTGKLEDGSEFSLLNIFADPAIQKFSWAEGFWYVSDRGIIEAENDLEALYIYFSL